MISDSGHGEMPAMGFLLSLWLALVLCIGRAAVGEPGTFTIANNRFVKDGEPLQIISGR